MKLKLLISIITISFLSSSCGKEFLEIKSDASIGTPSTAGDYQALLDYSTVLMNASPSYNLSMIATEEYWLKDEVWHAIPVTSNRKQQKNSYIWADNLYEDDIGNLDWDNAYRRILYANMVLDGFERKATKRDMDEWSITKGAALFYRAYNFYQLAQLFSVPYNESTAKNDLGIPLRLDADVTVKSTRSTLKETYDRILDDLTEAAERLPENALVKLRPSKLAAFALLARVYLQMGNFNKAKDYADLVLKSKDELVDYNLLNPEARYPFVADYGESNIEIIFFSFLSSPTILLPTRAVVNEELISLYNETDLRKKIYYEEGELGKYFFKGSLYGGNIFFVGLTVSEMLLVRAECNAREGNIESALKDIDRLASYRYKTGTFISYEKLTKEEMIRLVLDERRKELAFRGIRWEDLKRLNSDPRFATTLIRTIDDKVYKLQPNDKKYVLPIPQNVIELSGIEQNAR